MNRALLLGVVLTIGILWTIYLAPDLSAGEKTTPLPRYALKVGQELSYRTASSLGYLPGREASTREGQTEWTIYVIRQNRDGSWRLVLRLHETNEWWINDNQAKKQARPARVRTGVVFFDLFADGRIVQNNPKEFAIGNPGDLFPRLPPDAQSALKGWEETSEKEGRRSRFVSIRVEETAKSLWSFEERGEDLIDPAVYNWRCRFLFDGDRGLIRRAEPEIAWDTTGKLKGVTELTGVKTCDAAWLARLNEESADCMAAEQAYRTLTLRAETEKNVALIAEAENTIKKTLDKLTVPFLREQMAQRLQSLLSFRKGYDADEKRLKDLIGKPAGPWETKDLTGKAHSLKDYRGKVVILDFWYRRCLYCIKAMPQVGQIAEDFKDEPVVIFGMNTDDEDKDAQFIVERLKIPYPVLRLGWAKLSAQYQVAVWPTLVIIDQAGKIHAVYEGWSPTLRDDVGKAIRSLLTKK